jgi:hypothetical protein
VILRYGRGGALLGAAVGLGCGVLYSVGGFFVDLFTIGLNQGTLMAFGALIGMPAVFATVGLGAGLLLGAMVRLVRGAAGR